MKKLMVIALSLCSVSRLSLADNLDDFIWSASNGEVTTPESLQEENGGFIVTDADGNQMWVDNVEKPTCSFTSLNVRNESDDGFAGEINVETYVGELDLSGCDL